MLIQKKGIIKVKEIMKRPLMKLVLMSLIIYLVFLIRLQFYYRIGIKDIQAVMKIGIVMVLIISSFISYKKKNMKYLLTGVIICGVIMRIGYSLYTPSGLRQHDLASWGEAPGDCGHAGYIYNIYTYGELPISNSYQFYHPPFFHFLCAYIMKLTEGILPNLDTFLYFESTITVSCIASCILLIYAKKLANLIFENNSAKLLFLALISFFPNYYLTSGRINNDSLVNLFIFMIIYYTFKWYKTNKLSDLVILSLCFGFGMMTKLSCALMAFFTAPFMFVKLYAALKENKFWLQFKKYLIFAGISFPLGMWYPIRNLILFKQPFNYVMQLTVDSGQYLGNVDLFKRFSPTEIINLFSTTFAHPYGDYNVWNYIIETSVFGEFMYVLTDYFFVNTLKVCALLIILISLICILFKQKKKQVYYIGFTYLFVLQLVSYILFNLEHPQGCTMDFRYLIPIIPCLAYFMTIAFQAKNRIIKYSTLMVVFLFSISSIMMYTSIYY